jgi:hypothetical protein
MVEENGSSETGATSELGPAEDHRDRRIWWMLVGVGLVIFVAIILLGRPLVGGRLTAARNLDRATAMISETDGELKTIDSAVQASVSTVTPAQTEKALATLWATRLKLEDAARLSQDGYDRLTEDEQKRAVIVKNVAAARLEVLVPAETALSNGGAVNDQALREYEQAVKKARQAEAALAKL